MITISFFATRSSAGQALAQSVTELLETYGVPLKVITGGTQKEFTYACLSDDLVIFDGTIESDHNYAAATAQPMAMDHILIVSRAYLPINFYSLYSDTLEEFDGFPRYPESATNEKIITWLQKEFSKIIPHLPRPKNEKGVRGSLRSMRNSLAAESERNRRSVFMSYRSSDLDAVEKLIARIERGEFHAQNHSSVRVLKGGELAISNEILTEQRRWQVMSSIDRLIGECDELWVFESEQYYNSWWTLGELVTLAHRNIDKPVYIFNPKTNERTPAPPDYLPFMTKEQRHRMTRWYANSDPATMGPEAVEAMRLYAQLPFIGRFRYFHDHVWSDKFSHYPILDCPFCRTIGQNKNHPDMEAFLWTKEETGFHRLSPEQMEHAVETKEIACPKCQAVWPLESVPPRYLWMPIRYGKATTPTGEQLVELPTYKLGGTLKAPLKQG